MSERLQAWVHMKEEEEVDIARLEERIEPELAQNVNMRLAKFFKFRQRAGAGVCMEQDRRAMLLQEEIDAQP